MYADGDVYHGLWRHGQPHGPGRYKWGNGNEYNGEWVGGQMHGRGTYVWSTGERYDGEWCKGREHGRGVFTWADGSTFDGHWREGEKHGIGVCRAGEGGRWNGTGSGRAGGAAVKRQSHGGDELDIEDPAVTAAAVAKEWVLLREYDRNEVVFERLLPAKGLPLVPVVAKRERMRAGRHQRPIGPGEVRRARSCHFRSCGLASHVQERRPPLLLRRQCSKATGRMISSIR